MTFLSANPWHDVPQEDITYCEKCGKKIWKHWKNRDYPDGVSQAMKFCANDFFGR